jgi:DNA-binding LacI/PurR family transcriptional regulator
LEAESKLAVRFRVSIRTIREALSALAQEGLLERRHGSGTYVADFRSQQHVALWFAIDPLYPRADYAHRMLAQIHDSLQQQGILAKTYFVHQADNNFAGDAGYKELLDNLVRHRVSAFVTVVGMVGPEAVEWMRQNGIPWLHQAAGPAPIEASVGADHLGMVLDGTRRLLDQGCRRIAFMAWLDGREANTREQEMLTAFRSLLAERGAITRPEWVSGNLHPTMLGAGYEQFREIWASADEKPDGLLVTDDVLFQDVVTAIAELRIAVPAQLKVVAHANRGAVTCRFFPAPRMCFDPAEQAEAIAERVVKLVRKQPIEQRHVVLTHRWLEAPASKVAHALEHPA